MTKGTETGKTGVKIGRLGEEGTVVGEIARVFRNTSPRTVLSPKDFYPDFGVKDTNDAAIIHKAFMRLEDQGVIRRLSRGQYVNDKWWRRANFCKDVKERAEVLADVQKAINNGKLSELELDEHWDSETLDIIEIKTTPEPPATPEPPEHAVIANQPIEDWATGIDGVLEIVGLTHDGRWVARDEAAALYTVERL